MPRVTLEIFRGPYKPALASGIQIESCRLLTDLSLRSTGGWTVFRPAIVDTGAPVSLLPRRVWQSAEVHALSRIQVGGAVRKPECMLNVTLAVVVFAIRDAVSQLGPIEAHALLSDTDDCPMLLGMRGILSDLILHTDVSSGEAYLETASLLTTIPTRP